VPTRRGATGEGSTEGHSPMTRRTFDDSRRERRLRGAARGEFPNGSEGGCHRRTLGRLPPCSSWHRVFPRKNSRASVRECARNQTPMRVPEGGGATRCAQVGRVRRSGGHASRAESRSMTSCGNPTTMLPNGRGSELKNRPIRALRPCAVNRRPHPVQSWLLPATSIPLRSPRDGGRPRTGPAYNAAPPRSRILWRWTPTLPAPAAAARK
jgi:hypothetical protein